MKTMESVSIVLVGGQGYGSSYVKSIYSMEDERIHFAGVVDPFMQPSKTLDLLKEMAVPVFDTMEDFFKKRKADLCIISTPIHLHRRQLEEALGYGCHVLCEKPAAGTVNDVENMQRLSDDCGKLVGIGFQMSYSDGILEMKKDRVAGVYGKTLSAKSITLFPRPYSYFHGRGWAGKIIALDGTKIWDSIANNAAAHSLHNMMFCLGDTAESCGHPAGCRGQVYRVNNIETFDGVEAVIEVETQGSKIPFFYYGAHFVEETLNPTFEIQFEKGKVSYQMDEDLVRFIGKDGQEKIYGNAKDHKSKILWFVEAILSRKKSVPCSPGATLGHAKAVEALNGLMDKVYCFQKEEVEEGLMKHNQTGLIVKGFDSYLKENYEKGVVRTYESSHSWGNWT